MTQAINGSWVYLLMRDGPSGPYQMIGGQLSHTDSVTVGLVDITNKQSQSYRELLSNEGLLARDVSLELIFNSSASYDRLWDLSRTKGEGEFRIIRGATGLNDDFAAMVGTCTRTSADNDAVRATVTLLSTNGFSIASGPEIPGPPLVTLHPENDNVFSPGHLILYSRAINWASVQWKKDSVDIPGATSQDLFILDPPLGVCSLYQAVYTNTHGTAETLLAEVCVGGYLVRSLQSDIYPLAPLEDMGSHSISLQSGVLRDIVMEAVINDSGTQVLDLNSGELIEVVVSNTSLDSGTQVLDLNSGELIEVVVSNTSLDSGTQVLDLNSGELISNVIRNDHEDSGTQTVTLDSGLLEIE